MKRFALALVCLSLVSACADSQEVVSDETVETAPDLSDAALVVDFGLAGERSWFAVNDTVMGGVSEGEVNYSVEGLIFTGAVSTDNNGGFTSVRSPDDNLDLQDFERVVVRMRNTGQPFTMVLPDNPYWYQGQFRYDIDTQSEDWEVVEIPLADFERYVQEGGYPTPTGEMMQPEDRAQLYYLEFMSKLFEDGPFTLEVDYIAFD